MHRLLLLAALSSLALARPAAAEPADFVMTIAGFRVGALTIEDTRSGGSYRAAIRFHSAGLGGLFDYGLEGAAEGRATPGRALVPRRFDGVSQSPRKHRTTAIEWTDGTPSRVAVDPPRAEAVPPARAAGALDPASALARLIGPGPAGAACGESIAVFDGSRLVRLDLGAPERTAEGIACAGNYLRLGGEPITPIDPPECPFTLVYAVTEDGEAVLDRISVPTRFGEALIERRG